MELEELMSEYQKDNGSKSKSELTEMSRADRHPVLKRIRLQLIIESVLWAIVLSVYYTGFDGDQKSWYWNIILVVAIIFLLMHNLLGYRLMQSPINGPNITVSLKKFARKIRAYARISIATRVIAIAAMLAFFASTVIWNETKIIAGMLFVAVLLSLQIFLLWRMWKGRANRIQKKIDSLVSMENKD